MNSIRQKVNGNGTTILCCISALALTALLWGFKEMRIDVQEIRQDVKILTKEALYKCDYMEDQKRIWDTIDKITDRIK